MYVSKKRKKTKRQKRCDIVQIRGHMMALWGKPVPMSRCWPSQRGVHIFFRSFFLLPYCMQYCKLITLVCYVVCFMSLSFYHLTFQHLNFICSKRKKEKKERKERKRKKKLKKKEKKKEKKKPFCSFFHCQKLNGALYLDWKEFHMQSILKRKPA